MARPLRIEYPGAVYHITNRGNDKKAVFKDDQDRETFLKILAFVNKRYHWICHAYCLMELLRVRSILLDFCLNFC